MVTWTLDDVYEANPAKEGQRQLLQHLLRVGAANEQVLCHTAARLEELGSPYVAAMSQLPYCISPEVVRFETFGTKPSVSIAIEYWPQQFEIDLLGNLRQVPKEEAPTNRTRFWFTSVVAYVKLWQHRAQIHKRYSENFGTVGFGEVALSKIRYWMDLPEAQMAEPPRRYATLTPSRFRSEVARRLRPELLAATNRISRALSVSTLVNYAQLREIFGYFTMFTPGEIGGADAPVPLQSYFLDQSLQPPTFPADQIQRINAMVMSTTIDFTSDVRRDPMVSQLIAMNSLLSQGEPALAIMGCATALEWFLNEQFPEITRVWPDGRRESGSLTRFARSNSALCLDAHQRHQLMELALARNQIAHGQPRRRSVVDSSEQANAFDQRVRDFLLFALEICRAVNRMRG